jgi:arylsulfatase
VPQRFRDLYSEQDPNVVSFFGMMASIDENMGRLEAFLRETGLAENTIVVFLNDNGGTFGVPIWNAGMRGSKTQYYEGGHRSPCFIRWPSGKFRPPSDVAGLTEVQDLLPTLVDLCELKDICGATFDGISLAAVLRGEAAEPPDRTLVIAYGLPQQPAAKNRAAVLWRRWRLVENKELYDLASDFAQKDNIIQQHPEIAARLRASYERWWQGVEPFFGMHSAIRIGDDRENPATLTPSSHHEPTFPFVLNVREAGSPNDPWLIEVARSGEYEITLRRWPEEARAAITAGVPPWESQDKGAHYGLPAGKALPIRKAKLSVGDFVGEKPVGETEEGVVFRVSLKQGRMLLKGSFRDDADKELCGAYYVTVRRK